MRVSDSEHVLILVSGRRRTRSTQDYTQHLVLIMFYIVMANLCSSLSSLFQQVHTDTETSINNLGTLSAQL